ncbi:anaerobic glycerol-3-phosphate dehydrogenase subunit C [Mitsuokella jalaludinii]|uniref:anaerobic glycerol-3-phosphate dehydrogenase subunit C n=1 Tax=Mitsuokella jalaludinii TaxID=187979 RepID=UPI00200A1D3A|nr:anaerobic glycerol-3-phosphate dehydrogenase subunit C [Mitsuokella jalaludinii]MCQ1533845.1 anaerobic glycerol-3-phosphate dehydrogenase subunit C [Mitsuokella jalaludinii]
MSDTKMIEEDKQAVYSGDHCLSCTSCMANCPVMAASLEYRGPKLVAPAHGRMHFSQDDYEDSLDFCSNCKSCDRACPSGVAVSTLNMLMRGEYYRHHPHSKRDDMLAHGERMAKLVSAIPFGSTFANLGTKVSGALGVLSAMGIAGQRSMPSYASKTFYRQFKDIKQPKSDKKVLFYPGCSINYNEPHIGIAFVKVMNHNGYEVLVDEGMNCCGSPLVVTGYLDEAKEHADNNVSRILKWKEQGIPVVVCCTSCSLMLRAEYAELFGEQRMEDAAENIYDAFEFLEELMSKGELKTDFKRVDKKLIYHVPCHLKTQGIGTPAVSVLKQVPGVEVELADAGCCGISGNYGFKKEKYDISMKIGEKLFERIKESTADDVICDCPTCRMQIKHGTQTDPCHPIEILEEAYR